MLRRWIITLVMLALALAAIWGYKQNLQAAQQTQGESMPEPAAVVEAQQAQLVDYQAKVQVNGQVVPAQQLQLSNELAGKIAQLSLPSGGKVKKGQLLVAMDSSEEKARLAAAKASLLLAEQRVKRVTELRKTNKISAEDLDTAMANQAVAKAEIAALEATIAKKHLYAPFDAVVGIHNLEQGQYLQANSEITHLVGIQDYVWVDFSLPQTYGELPLQSSVWIKAISQNATVVEAKIVAMEPSLSSASRQLRYRAKVDISQLPLKPNTLVKVTVPLLNAQQQVAVPDLAISRDQAGEYVFLLDDEGEGAYRAKRQKIIIGARQGQQVFIQSGLEVGQLVATKGAFKLRPGIKVYISQPAA